MQTQNSPGLTVRVRTRLRRSRLDNQLARGADPGGSPELAVRAEQLRSPEERARIANALVEALGDARRGEPVTLRMRPQRDAVRDAADAILALALRLRDDAPADATGVAKAAWLVSDRSSPLHRGDAGDLADAIASAHAHLDAALPQSAELEARAA